MCRPYGASIVSSHSQHSRAGFNNCAPPGLGAIVVHATSNSLAWSYCRACDLELLCALASLAVQRFASKFKYIQFETEFFGVACV
jgi:hypothetical protein